MKYYAIPRGFRGIDHPNHANEPIDKRLVQESSAICFEYPDALDNPGSSFLWIGDDHHLDRDEVEGLIRVFEYWLEHKRMPGTQEELDALLRPHHEGAKEGGDRT